MNYFTTLLGRHQSSLTLTQLQSKIFVNKTNKCNDNTQNPTINQPEDLKIISPFYKRIDQHPQNCKCMYHKRARSQIKLIQKVKTQTIQIVDKKQQNQHNLNLPTLTPPLNVNQDQITQTQEFNNWKQKLSTDVLKNFYYEYLKTIPNCSKFKRHKELDCYNPAFEQFLKDNYLIILDQKKTQKDIKNKANKLSHKFNQSQLSQAFINKYPSTRDGLKVRKIIFKSLGKQQQLSEQQIQRSDKKQKKPIKKHFSNRSSFFGLIQDQQVLRQICSRFIHPNKSQNKEAELMMKQIVESDIEMYTKIMNDMEQNLEQGVILPHLDETHSNILVKIVLQKMSKEVKSIKKKDSNLQQKTNIIQNICSRYGWSKDQKKIDLQQFWKITQSVKNVGLSRKSLGAQIDSKFKDSRSYQKNSRASKISRMSGFSKDKMSNYFSNTLNSQTSSNISNRFLPETQIVEEQKQQIKLKVIEQFKINTNKAGALKKGVLVNKKKKRKLTGLMDCQQTKKINGLVRKETCFIQAIQQQRQLYGSNNNLKQLNTETNVRSSKDYDDRNSSVYSNTKNTVLRHIETNKKFLKRIQNQLKGNDCDQLVIGIGTNLLTKKRKIRAIYNALQSQDGISSTKHTNLLKYLQIYEQYCDLIVKQRKQKKSKSQASLVKISQPNFQEKNNQAQQIGSLIQDLSKQRQLKYFNLKWLEEKQDPKQELILKIPQKQKNRQKRLVDNKKIIFIIQNTKVQKNQENAQVQCVMFQKSLEDHVNVYCQMSRSALRQTSFDKQTQVANQQKLSDFQKKILSYRKILKLQDSE